MGTRSSSTSMASLSASVAAVAVTTTFLLISISGRTTGYSQGAPDAACVSLTPAHGSPAQTSPSPYTITPSTAEVEGGKRMVVTLEGSGGAAFKGFLLQAQSAETESLVGTFFTTEHKYMNCGNGFNNAITHQGPSSKSKVTLDWEPASDFEGDVFFFGSFVQDKNTYWVRVPSEKVTVKRSVGGAGPATTTPTAAAAAPPTTPSPSVSPSDQIGGQVNAGDVVISVVEAPSGVVESDTPPAADTPISPSPAPSPLTTTPTPVDVNTGSSDSVGPDAEEEEEEEPVPEPSTSPRPRPQPGPKRKFGLLGRRRTTTTTTTTTTPATMTTTTGPLEKQEMSPEAASLERDLINVYDDCGDSKGCFGFPAECEANKKCDMLVTYSKVSSGYKFEIVGSTTSGYVAAGLSDDEKMGGDSVMACMVTDSGAVDVVMGFNNGKSNELLVEKKYGLSNIQAAVVDGKTYCTFIRDSSTEISGIVFDLDNDRFHLMLSTGPTRANGLSYHDKRTVSSGTVGLDSFEAVEVRSDLFRTLHACLMVGAWICAASCGIMVARYYKKTWLKTQTCGIDHWFHVHRFFMILTWSLTVAGLVLIVYYLNGWTDIDIFVNPHPYLGIVSTGLCFIQPFMAMCRCHPTHKRRPIFNWLHWFVGNSAQILGIAAIYFGFELIGSPTWVVFILIIFIAYHCLIHLLLSVGQCISDSRAENSNNVYPMKELNGSRAPLQPPEGRMDAPGAGFRKVMLFLYFVGNFIITAALLLVIIVEEEMLKKWGLIFWEK